MTICGKQGGKSFAEAQKPNSDGTCPNNMVPCSNATSRANTICVAPQEFEAGQCPITEIQFLNQNQTQNLDSTVYSIQPIKGD